MRDNIADWRVVLYITQIFAESVTKISREIIIYHHIFVLHKLIFIQ